MFAHLMLEVFFHLKITGINTVIEEFKDRFTTMQFMLKVFLYIAILQLIIHI